MTNKKMVILISLFLLILSFSSVLCISSDKPSEPANQPPTVKIIADITEGIAPLAVNFKADAEDPDGFIDTYNWDFGDGTDSSKEKIIHTYYTPGSYDTTLIVTDSSGAQASDTIKITVEEQTLPNEPPNANAAVEPLNAFTNEEIFFNGTGEDNDGWIILYDWDFDGDGISDWFSNTTGFTKFAYNTSGIYNPVFWVTDNDYESASDSVRVTIELKADKPPVAIISQPENNSVFDVDEEIQFDGSESYDPEQSSLTYTWLFGDGRASYQPNPTHVYSEGGTYNVVLTVNDEYNEDSDAITIEIIEYENQPPVAVIISPENNEAFEVNTEVYFDGTNSSDPDGDILYYYWDFGDGNFDTGVTTTHVYIEVSTYTITLSVNDGELTDSDNVRILITNDSLNQPPEAVIDEPENGDNFTINEVIRFNGSSSNDPDGDELNFTWNFMDGSTGYGMITTHQYSTNGTYNVSLTVTDGQYYDMTRVIIIVGPGSVINTPPTAIISEPTMLSSFETNQTVNCSGYLSFDPEGDFLLYRWDFGDGSEYAYSMNTTHRYSEEGRYQITLTVSDGEFNDTDIVIITVVAGTGNNSAPTAEIVTPFTGQSFVVNQVITFDGSNSSDPDGDELTYTWYFGDGTTGTGVTTTHQYSTPGLFTVTLEVSDGQLNDTDRVTIIIKIQ